MLLALVCSLPLSRPVPQACHTTLISRAPRFIALIVSPAMPLGRIIYVPSAKQHTRRRPNVNYKWKIFVLTEWAVDSEWWLWWWVPCGHTQRGSRREEARRGKAFVTENVRVIDWREWTFSDIYEAWLKSWFVIGRDFFGDHRADWMTDVVCALRIGKSVYGSNWKNTNSSFNVWRPRSEGGTAFQKRDEHTIKP